MLSSCPNPQVFLDQHPRYFHRHALQVNSAILQYLMVPFLLTRSLWMRMIYINTDDRGLFPIKYTLFRYIYIYIYFKISKQVNMLSIQKGGGKSKVYFSVFSALSLVTHKWMFNTSYLENCELQLGHFLIRAANRSSTQSLQKQCPQVLSATDLKFLLHRLHFVIDNKPSWISLSASGTTPAL